MYDSTMTLGPKFIDRDRTYKVSIKERRYIKSPVEV
jgi:hypothetical protein